MPYCKPEGNSDVYKLKQKTTTKPATRTSEKGHPIVASPEPMELVESPVTMDPEEMPPEASSQDVRVVAHSCRNPSLTSTFQFCLRFRFLGSNRTLL